MTTELTVRDVFDLQLREVSGICERAAADGRPRQLLAIGDDSHHLLVGDLEPEVPASFARTTWSRCWPRRACGSAAAPSGRGRHRRDGAGVRAPRGPGHGVRVRPGLRRLLHVLPLTVEDDPGEQRAWDADENALGEGLLLLRNGHLFVVKEEKPRQLLEFGLPGERAQGLHGDLLIADRGRFPTPTSRPPPSTCCRPGTWAGRPWSGSAT